MAVIRERWPGPGVSVGLWDTEAAIVRRPADAEIIWGRTGATDAERLANALLAALEAEAKLTNDVANTLALRILERKP
jgi:hypothetical protein